MAPFVASLREIKRVVDQFRAVEASSRLPQGLAEQTEIVRQSKASPGGAIGFEAGDKLGQAALGLAFEQPARRGIA